MSLHNAPGGPPFANDENRHDRRGRRPAQFPAQHRAKAGLDVESSKRLLEVTQHGLDLDDQQGSSRRVKRDDVDTPALTEMVEADLGAHDVSCLGKHPSDRFLERRVGGIEQAVELLTLPSELDDQRRVECCGDPIKRLDRQAAHLATLETRYQLMRHPCAIREIPLP